MDVKKAVQKVGMLEEKGVVELVEMRGLMVVKKVVKKDVKKDVMKEMRLGLE
jgi:hypothetical protein